MAYKIIDNGGSSSTTFPVPVIGKCTVTGYKFNDVRNNYSGAEPTGFMGKVNVYNAYGSKIGVNHYGYVSEIVTNDFKGESGEIMAGGGPHTIEFYSIFKISDKSEDGEEFYKLSMVTGEQVWQTIRYSTVNIYLEDETHNPVDLDPYKEGVGISTLCNAAKTEIGELPPYATALLGKLFEYLIEGFKAVMGKTVGIVIGVASALACFVTPKFKHDEFSLTNRYDSDRNKVLVDFSWGNPDQVGIQTVRHRQELVFKIYINFYAPPKPGNYTLVFDQILYVNPSSECRVPQDDTEYRWFYNLQTEPGSSHEAPCWVRIFETRYPVTLVQPKPSGSGRFVVNTHSKEIHDTLNSTPACNIGLILEDHKKYFDSVTEVEQAIAELGYNGCHHCMPDYDKG